MKITPLAAACLTMRASSGSIGPVKLIFMILAPEEKAQSIPFSSWNVEESAGSEPLPRKARTLSSLASGATPLSAE